MPRRPVVPGVGGWVVAALAALVCVVPVVVGASETFVQPDGPSGCFARAGQQGCAAGGELKSILSLAVSPDDASLYAASLTGAQLSIFDRDRFSGQLTPKPGDEGCFAAFPDGREICALGRAIEVATDVVVSSDGRNVYVTSLAALNVFDRDPATGRLREKPGRAGCISDERDRGLCSRARHLAFASSVAVSPDAKHVYVGADRAIVIFDRDPRSGALSQKRCRSGCVSPRGRCTRGRALRELDGITLSPDGKSLYASSLLRNSIAVFDRAEDGTLRQKRGARGCLARSATLGSCRRLRLLDAPDAIRVSRDQRHVYVVAPGSDVLLAFHLSPTGELRPTRGRAHCLVFGRPRALCRSGRVLEGPVDLAIAPDDLTVAAAVFGSDAIALLDRDPQTGTLTHREGPDGCFATRMAGCTHGRGLDGPSALTFSHDGRNLYVAATGDDALVTLRR